MRMIKEILPLIQLCDSNFPSGAFSHSFGLETYIQEDYVTTVEEFKQFLHVYILKSLTYTDGLGCRIAYDLAAEQKLEELWETSMKEQLKQPFSDSKIKPTPVAPR